MNLPLTRTRIVTSLLLLGTLLVYLPAAHCGFTLFDDTLYLSENPIVQNGLTAHGFAWAFTTFHASNWHPLTWLSLMLDCQLFGLNAGGSHLVNVLFHAVNTVLLFRLLLRWTGDPDRSTAAFWTSAFVAALFAWHPLHVESVAWISERKDVLSTFFALLSLLYYTHYAQKCEGRSGKDENRQPILNSQLSTLNYFLALFFFACALMAKPMFVTLPFVLLLLDYWPLNRIQPPAFSLQPFREKFPFVLLAAGSCFLTYAAQHHGGAVVSLGNIPLSYRFENASVALAGYLAKLAWPVNLSIFYPLQRISTFALVLSLAVLAAIFAAVWCGRTRRPALLVGWLWFVGTLVPVIGFVLVGSAAMADRYLYFPSIGIFLALALGARDLLERFHFPRPMIVAGATVLLTACLVLTHRQLGYWHDDVALFAHAAAVTKNNGTAHLNLGYALQKEGRKTEAITQYRAALEIDARNAPAHNDLALLLEEKNQVDDALKEFEAAIRVEPGYTAAHNNYGLLLVQLGRYDDALAQYAAAARSDPADWHAPYLAGKALLKLGRDAEALPYLRQAVRNDPDNPQILLFTTHVLASDENPAIRDGKSAFLLAQKANALTGGHQPAMIDALAMAYAENNLFDDAQKAAQDALELADRFAMTNDVPLIQKRLELYKNHQAFRQSFKTTEPSGKH